MSKDKATSSADTKHQLYQARILLRSAQELLEGEWQPTPVDRAKYVAKLGEFLDGK
jgi:hypothetical protein